MGTAPSTSAVGLQIMDRNHCLVALRVLSDFRLTVTSESYAIKPLKMLLPVA